MAHRGLSPEDIDVHVGIDGGQGWLKLGLSVTEKSEANNNGRAHYSEVHFYLFVTQILQSQTFY